MRKVIGIGETVLDIIFKGSQPIGAYPGGSTFNSIISLGRCGVNAQFISEAGADRVGDQVLQFLTDNGVDGSCVSRIPGSKSPLSLAFLNEQNDAEYIFYKDHPHDRLDFALPDIQTDDIVIFGSYYALNPVIRPQVVSLLERARQRGAIVYYDVNFRPSHRDEVVRLTPNLLENLEYADIVRGSTDDFDVLFHTTDPDRIYNAQIAFYCKKFILTRGAKSVVLRADSSLQREYPVAPTETVSTIGAGDNFNAGLIFGLLREGITRRDIERGLTPAQWDSIIACALSFSAEVCRSLYNYVSPEFGQQMQQSSKVTE